MAREAMARSVVPSIRADIPTPLPPPVTVTDAVGLVFMYISESSCDRGRTVSLPLIRCADNVPNEQARTVRNRISTVLFIRSVVLE